MEEREKLRAKWRDKEDDVRMNGNPAVFELLHAATVCAQALSCSRVDDKVRFHTLSKVLDGLGGDNIERKLHNHPEVEQHVYVQESCLGGYAHNEKSQDSSQKMLNEGCVQEGQEQLLSFLNKAMAQGALELKDMDSVLRCLRESGKEVWKGKETAQHDESYVQIPATDGEKEQLHFAGNQEHSTCSKERDEPLRPMGKDPPVFTQVWVPQKTSVPTKGTLSSHVPGDQGKKGQLCLHVPHCMADEKDKEEPHTQPQTRKVHSCSDMHMSKSFPAFMENSEKGVRGNNIHVNHSLSPLSFSAEHCSKKEEAHVNHSLSPLSFLEVVKKNLKASQSHSSHHERECVVQNAQPTSSSLEESNIFKIEKEVFLQRMKMCRFSVVAKITLMKGDEPWLWKKLKEKLDDFWGLKTEWRLISLGKGFFHVILNSQEDLNRVWSKGILHLKPGVLRLQRWNFGFDPSKEKTTKAQVWFRIHNLPWCLWDISVLNGIASKIGAPIRIDKATMEGSFGHYARILVEVDLSKTLKATVLTECNGQIFEVKIVPEHLPSFCKECLSIGHLANNCRFLNKNRNDAGMGKVPVKVNDCRDHKSGESLKPLKKNKGGVQALFDSENIISCSPPSGECSGSHEQVLTQKDEAANKSTLELNENSSSIIMERGKSYKEKDCSMLADFQTTSVGPKGKKRVIQETIADFSVQTGNEMVICNTFSPLAEITSSLDSNEEILIDDNGEFDLPKLPPHVKEKWSNIIDEEEEVVTAPVPFDGLILPPSCMTEVDYTTREALIHTSIGSTSTTPLYGQWLHATKRKSKKGKTDFKHKPVRNV